MKRSELLDRLMNELHKVLNKEGVADLLTCIQAAEIALTCCEDAGMEPPYNNGDISFPNEWEPEDNGCGAV